MYKRQALGAAVVFGMAMNTLLATIYIPNFYELMQKLQERFSKKTVSYTHLDVYKRQI